MGQATFELILPWPHLICLLNPLTRENLNSERLWNFPKSQQLGCDVARSQIHVYLIIKSVLSLQLSE